jgi:type II secretory ATPase GspE/PulE/Tfp pilus assembly ATPase PilB-like protein
VQTSHKDHAKFNLIKKIKLSSIMTPDSDIVTQDTLAATARNQKLSFQDLLQEILQSIHAARHIEDILPELNEKIRRLFGAERVTIFVPNLDNTMITSKIATYLSGAQQLKLPVSSRSIAGFVALRKIMVNVQDAYDADELKRIHPELRFLSAVDKQTGFHTKQVLAFPIINQENGKLMAVVEVLNTLSGASFSSSALGAAATISKPLSIALNPRRSPRSLSKTRFWPLIVNKILTEKEMEQAFRNARSKNTDLETYLLEDLSINPNDLGQAYSQFFNVPFEAYSAAWVQPVSLQRTISQEYALSNEWLPLDENEKEGLIILSPEPEKIRNSHIVNQAFPRYSRITYKICLRRDFVRAVDLFYGADDFAALRMEEEEEEDINAASMVSAQDNELVKLVNRIIIDAYNQGASDIHIEPYPDRTKTEVRIRKDGSLVHYANIPPVYRNAIASRIKIMCDMDISERRKPQDGKIRFKRFGPLDIELRVATIPTSGGVEDIVMRILSGGEPLPLEKLGLNLRNEAKLKQIISMPYGLFFVCGPTGSGKTTTLHSALKYINTPETKIWTAEDPVEITQKGLRQVQMNPKAGLDFATAMKSFLRADPDVIMVGEMRDHETVSIGIEASLTGHLVLTTLHTNSAPESLVRLLDMGMDPFNFADALLGVLAQRLAKKLCDCKTAHIASAEEIDLLLQEYCLEMQNLPSWKANPKAAREAIFAEWKKHYADEKGQFTLYQANSCKKCDKTGYKGRIGLYELMEGTPALKKNIQDRARVVEMFITAMEDGMRTLKQDGIEKVLQGITDIKQVRAVCIK